ncbi:MAG: hypothetical protein EBZ48_01845, partial [Proteobacteria bacterium]|nr:hypothetical protein [Pseudomonadota bacterium]
DLELADDPYESFKIFQGKIYDEYKRMWKEFNFNVVNAELPPETQQHQVRALLRSRIDLDSFRQKSVWKGLAAGRAGVSRLT